MQGIISAVPTVFDSEGVPQKAAYLKYCQWLLDNGCDGLNILGSTGEANSISNTDRKEIMGWAAKELDTERLMVGTGTPSLNDTIEITTHADNLGYPVALVLPPFYYKPISNAGLIAWYKTLDDALADRPIQIYFYNFPQMTGISIPVEVIADLATQLPNRFTGIKDSSSDLDYCRAIVAASSGMSVFPSSETSIDQAHSSQFAGCISATVNITASLSAEAWNARADTLPSDLMEKIAQQRTEIANAGLIPAIKYLVADRSKDPDWCNILPPFLPLDKDAGKTLVAKIQN